MRHNSAMQDESEQRSGNMHEFSVSELSQVLKRHIEDGFSYVRVRGELSGLARPASGHMYFGLKEDKTVLDGICWKGAASRLAFRPEDGLEVVCTGKLTTYPDRSKYQIVVTHMEPAGEGAMMALLEERKKKLAAEGLFAAERKKAIPYIPRTIGVVTSPTGAVIRDILHRLSDRFPRHVLVWPVKVQGEGAAAEITAAIKGFNAITGDGALPRPDVLIVARGGGSIEDLWAFNEEDVVRAAAASQIPLISAVGHETDTTLIDHASDLRAPTPTAAAEKAVPVLADLRYTVSDFQQRLEGARVRKFERAEEKLRGLSRGLPRPEEMLGLAQQRMDDLRMRLPRALNMVASENATRLERIAGGLSASSLRHMVRAKSQTFADLTRRAEQATKHGVDVACQRFSSTSRLLESLSYTRVLERGFAAVFDASGKPVTSRRSVTMGAALDVEFNDGRVGVTVGESTAGQGAIKPPKKVVRAKAKTPKNTDQGSLF